MGTFVELFSKLFAYVLLWEQQCAAAGPQRSYEQVRHDMTKLLQEQEAAAASQPIALQQFLAARLAVIAWADEVILGQTGWAYHDHWQAIPLQAEYYGTSPAEVAKLAELQQLFLSEPAVQEVYALCLSLGFSGRRGSGLTDRLYLTDIHSQLQHGTHLLFDDVWTSDFKLTPQAYEGQSPTRYAWRSPHALVGLLALIGVALGLWMVQRAAPPACVPSPTLPSTIQQRLAGQQCSRIAVEVQECVVTLSGRIELEAQRKAIRDLIGELKGVNRVRDTLRIIPRPFCDVLALLEPIGAQAAQPAVGLRVRLNKTGDPPLYTAGNNFTLEVTTPRLFASYLYVDFYSSDGRVRYLYSNPVLGQPFPPGSVHTLGLVDGKPIWGIEAPYGRGLVAVIASQTPLVFPQPAAHFAPGSAEGYLAQLRQALSQERAQAGLDVAFVFIEMRAQ